MEALPSELKRIGEVIGEGSELLLRDVFYYESFSKNNYVVKMLEAMYANVCPYCNVCIQGHWTEIAENPSRSLIIIRINRSILMGWMCCSVLSTKQD